jgi:hypothetical protein
MVDQNLLTIFLGLTTLSILIQSGVIAGLFYVTLKMSRQADRALSQSRLMFDPLHRIVDTLQTGSARINEFANSSRAKLKRTQVQ